MRVCSRAFAHPVRVSTSIFQLAPRFCRSFARSWVSSGTHAHRRGHRSRRRCSRRGRAMPLISCPDADYCGPVGPSASRESRAGNAMDAEPVRGWQASRALQLSCNLLSIHGQVGEKSPLTCGLRHFTGCQDASDVLGKSGSASRRTWGTIRLAKRSGCFGKSAIRRSSNSSLRFLQTEARHPARLRRRRAGPTSGSGAASKAR